jgi:hypothetical protein
MLAEKLKGSEIIKPGFVVNNSYAMGGVDL